MRHSRASDVMIRLEQTADSIRLDIRDNGIGFDVARTRKGLGLNNIFTRVEHYKGTVVIDSRPGGGCLLRAVLPVAQAQPAPGGV